MEKTEREQLKEAIHEARCQATLAIAVNDLEEAQRYLEQARKLERQLEKLEKELSK